MTKSGFFAFALGCLLLPYNTVVQRADAAETPPAFKEIYDLLRAHLPDATDASLDAAAARGLVSALAPKVTLLSATEPPTNNAAPAVRIQLFDRDLVCLRVRQVAPGLDQVVRDAVAAITATNKIRGLVFDLRYATGSDYGAAAATAELFLMQAKPLLNWGQGVVQSKEKTDAIGLPVAVVVNRETSGAPEALAAVLRATGTGLILGKRTAGSAMTTKDYALKDGDRLRIATEPVVLGDGTALSGDGVKPDITVEVNPAEEKIYYEDPYRLMLKGDTLSDVAGRSGQTNSVARTARRNRYTEAELVRDRKEGTNIETDPRPAREPEPEKPVVRDPALARALDLLKGLAVVRRTGA